MKNKIPDVPALNDPEFMDAVGALARSADIMRKATLDQINGVPLTLIMKSYGDDLVLAEKIITRWYEHISVIEQDPKNVH